MVTYDKQKYLQYLQDPYKTEQSRNIPPELRLLKFKILKLNARTRNANDYIQSKHHFKQKVKNFVTVPKTYYIGNDLEAIRRHLLTLDEFVLKPNHLSQGIGVRLLNRIGNVFNDINGDVLTIDDIIDECRILLGVQRFQGDREIMIEERIRSHPDLIGLRDGIADIRMIYYRKNFLMCIARFPSDKSNGYGNVSRGADLGYVFNDGYFVDDIRFKNATIHHGKLPHFDNLANTGRKVATLFGIAFQSIDMTIIETGEVIVIESEALAQLEYNLAPQGIDWLNSVMARDLDVGWIKSITQLNYKRVQRILDRTLHGYAKAY